MAQASVEIKAGTCDQDKPHQCSGPGNHHQKLYPGDFDAKEIVKNPEKTNRTIFVSQYKLYLPTEEQLIEEVRIGIEKRDNEVSELRHSYLFGKISGPDICTTLVNPHSELPTD